MTENHLVAVFRNSDACVQLISGKLTEEEGVEQKSMRETLLVQQVRDGVLRIAIWWERLQKALTD